MSRTTTRFVAVLATIAAAFAALAQSPAAASRQCDDGWTVYVVNPLADGPLLAADLDGDGTICISVAGEVAATADNSDLAALLPAGLLDGLISITGPVTIDGVDVTTGDIFSTDQRGNRNNVVGGLVCAQNAGNSCFSNNKLLQHIRIVVLDDVL